MQGNSKYPLREEVVRKGIYNDAEFNIAYLSPDEINELIKNIDDENYIGRLLLSAIVPDVTRCPDVM